MGGGILNKQTKLVGDRTSHLSLFGPCVDTTPYGDSGLGHLWASRLVIQLPLEKCSFLGFSQIYKSCECKALDFLCEG